MGSYMLQVGGLEFLGLNFMVLWFARYAALWFAGRGKSSVLGSGFGGFCLSLWVAGFRVCRV